MMCRASHDRPGDADDVARHLASEAIPPERALVVVASSWPERTWRQLKRALTRR